MEEVTSAHDFWPKKTLRHDDHSGIFLSLEIHKNKDFFLSGYGPLSNFYKSEWAQCFNVRYSVLTIRPWSQPSQTGMYEFAKKKDELAIIVLEMLYRAAVA